MLRHCRIALKRAKGYENRVMYFSYRRQNAGYLPPKLAHRKDPTANKNPEEYHETWDQRTGVEWFYKMRRRNQYRHWPWVTWKDDPIRHHADGVSRRAFSVKNAAVSEKPLWNLYELVGQDYRLANTAPVIALAPIIALYTAKVWSKKVLEGYLAKLEPLWPTVHAVQSKFSDVEAWNRKTNALPPGLMTHLKYLADDVVLLNQKKAFRLEQHEKGYLRTNDMQRYFALPYLRTAAAAMPTTLEQPQGIYPRGAYTENNGKGVKIHPSYRLDGRTRHAMYPE